MTDFRWILLDGKETRCYLVLSKIFEIFGGSKIWIFAASFEDRLTPDYD